MERNSGAECSKCKGDLYIPYTDSEGIVRGKPCECQTKVLFENRLSFAKIPKANEKDTIENFDLSIYYDQDSKEIINIAYYSIINYINDFDYYFSQGTGLYIFSHTKGTGKTRMAASIANKLIEKGKMVRFAVSTTILQEIKFTWDKSNDLSESKLMKDLVKTPVLIIDDFGVEIKKPSDWANSIFYQIIVQRENELRPTIFTSNYAVNELRHGDRTKDRLNRNYLKIAFPEEGVRETFGKQLNQKFVKNLEDKVERGYRL